MSAVIIIPRENLPSLGVEDKPSKAVVSSDPRVKEIFKKAMIDLLMGSLCIAVTAPFAAAPIAIGVGAIGVIAQVVLSAAFRYFIGSVFSQEEEKSLPSIVYYVPAFLFAMFSFIQVGTLIHEIGHATAASFLFQNSAPKITLHTFAGGVTQYGTSLLSHLGGSLGGKNAYLFIAAAGSMLATAFSLLQIAFSHFFKETRPELSRYLLASSIFSTLMHVSYALSTFNPTIALASGHDFRYLYQVGGIHPALFVITFIALPIILKLALYHAKRVS